MSKTEISEIESLVNVISSEEVRTQTRLDLLYKLAYEKKGKLEIHLAYVDEIVDVFQRKSAELDMMCEEGEQGALLTYAARVAKHAGKAKQARQLYERAINFNDEKKLTLVAARVAVEAEMENKAKELYEKVFLWHEQRKDFAGAARIADEAKMPEKADAYRALEKRLKTPHEY